MRLLNVETLSLEEFVADIPPYAILSHRWGSEEVSLQEITNDVHAIRRKEGYGKIIGCCAKAKADGFGFVWIDTCCIDKTSSAELSEAINSMFRWYQGADICYAYLNDVTSSEDPADADSAFRRSKWFTRGWTLQELVAPTEVAFLTSDWVEIGTKKAFCVLVSNVTMIPEFVLQTSSSLAFTSIAQRMSWAARRSTTRIEDEAYCLLGLFNINMPLLYGEGTKAFHRLILEIVRTSSDDSVFACTTRHPHGLPGLLAESPKSFADSHGIQSATLPTTESHDINKDYVRLTVWVLPLMRKPRVNNWEQWECNSKIVRPRFCASDVFYEVDNVQKYLPLLTGGKYVSLESAYLAVLHCRDGQGNIGIPVLKIGPGRYVRFGGRLLSRWFSVDNIVSSDLESADGESILVKSRPMEAQPSPDSPSDSYSGAYSIQSVPAITTGYHMSAIGTGYHVSGISPKDVHTEYVSREVIDGDSLTLFFRHENPASYPSFSFGLETTQIEPEVKWSTIVRCEVRMPGRERNLNASWEPGGPDAVQVALYDDKAIIFRMRRSRQHGGGFYNVSIETRLPWCKEVELRELKD